MSWPVKEEVPNKGKNDHIQLNYNNLNEIKVLLYGILLPPEKKNSWANKN